MPDEWTPYRPPWYPNQDATHNPWATDPTTIQSGGRTFCDVWMGSLAPGELERLIREHQQAARA
jgi:hypothetical protein